jgi:hypothetical protein
MQSQLSSVVRARVILLVHYRILFDVTSPPWAGWLFSAAGLLFIVGGIGFYQIAREKYGRKQAFGGGIIVASIGVVFTILTCRDVNARHDALIADLRAGRVTTLEGRVSKYVHRGYFLDHTPESWVVSGRTFVMRPAEVRVSFNETGIVQPGDSVRITLVGDAIVRLERAAP